MSLEIIWKVEVRGPRPRSRIDENARCERGGDEAMAIASFGEAEVEVISTRNGMSEREVGRGCLTSTQTRRRGGNGPI